MARRKGIFGRRGDGGGTPLDAPIPSGAEAEHLEEEAARRIEEASRQAEWETVAPAEQLEDARAERDAATRTLQETLARLEDAERRATAAEQARTEVERASRQDMQAAVDPGTETLRGEPQLFSNDAEPRMAAAGAERARAYAEGEVRERIARIEGDAEERLRAEVAVARKAAEDRFAEKLASRERDLEREREQKVLLIEESHRRLSQIEARAVEAAERVDAAERRLAEEVKHLRAEAEAHVTAEAERARQEASEAADARARERDAELAESLAISEQAKRAAEAQVQEAQERERAAIDAVDADVEGRIAAGSAEAVAEAERRARAAEDQARESAAASATAESDARLAAAEWLRGQTKALRDEGAREGRGDIVAVEETAREAAAAERLADAERNWEVERSTLTTDLGAARGRIEEAEVRASEAEARAEQAEIALNDLADVQREDRLQEAATRIEAPKAEVEEATEQTTESRRTGFRGLFGRSARSAPTPVAADDDLEREPEDAVEPPEPEPIVEATPGRIVYSRVPPKPREVGEPEPVDSSETDGDADDDRISLMSAGVEQLREIGFSASQAKRLIRYREERGLDSVEGLEEVPGFSRAFLDTVVGRLRD